MTDVAGAYVTIEAETGGFEQDLEARISGALARAQVSGSRSLQEIADDAVRSAAQVAGSYEDGGRAASSALSGVGDAAAAAGRSVSAASAGASGALAEVDAAAAAAAHSVANISARPLQEVTAAAAPAAVALQATAAAATTTAAAVNGVGGSSRTTGQRFQAMGAAGAAALSRIAHQAASSGSIVTSAMAGAQRVVRSVLGSVGSMRGAWSTATASAQTFAARAVRSLASVSGPALALLSSSLSRTRSSFTSVSSWASRTWSALATGASGAGMAIVTAFARSNFSASRLWQSLAGTIVGVFGPPLATARYRLGVFGRAAGSAFSRLGPILSRIGSGIASVAGPIGSLISAIGPLPPLIASLIPLVLNIAPAAAVAATGVLAIVSAVGALKLGMSGVGDTLKLAFDPSKAKQFHAALKKLAPSAREFVLQIRSMRGEFGTLKLAVQQRLFRGLAGSLRSASSVLPTLRGGLLGSAAALNGMVKGVITSAQHLSASGTFGVALAGANRGLMNLRAVPGQVVSALVTIGAAAAPAFARITSGAAGAATSISAKLNAAFKSGAITKAINTAIGLIKQLGSIVGSVFKVIQNVMTATAANGGGMLGVIQKIATALAQFSGTPAFASAMQAIGGTLSALTASALPLLMSALQAVAPILTALAPPVQQLVSVLGPALMPIVAALAPLLVTAAQGVGVLVQGLLPLLPVIGSLVSSLLPALAPILTGVTTVFTQLAPIVTEVANILMAVLAPIISQLPAIITPLVGILTTLTGAVLAPLGDLLAALSPLFTAIGTILGQVAAALAPVLSAIGQLVGQLLSALMPVLTPIIALLATLAGIIATTLGPVIGQLAAVLGTLLLAFQPLISIVLSLVGGALKGLMAVLTPILVLVGQLVAVFAKLLAGVITTVVIPVITILAELLQGHFSTAWHGVIALVSNLNVIFKAAMAKVAAVVGEAVGAVLRWLGSLAGRAGSALAGLGGTIGRIFSSAFGRLESTAISATVNLWAWVKGVPGRITSTLGNLGSLLTNAGSQVISGLIHGIEGEVGKLKAKLSSITKLIPSWKGPASVDKTLLTPTGRLIMQGLMAGISAATPSLRQQLRNATAAIVTYAKQGLVAGLTGTSAQITSAINKITSEVTRAYETLPADLITRDQAKLKSNAAKREQLLKELADTSAKNTRKRARIRAELAALDASAHTKQLNAEIAAARANQRAGAAILKIIASDNAKLQALAKQKAGIATRLVAAQSALADAQKLFTDEQQTVSDGILSSGDITKVGGDAPTPESIIAGLQNATKAAAVFAQNLATLKARGLSDSLLKQIADAGVDGGAATAAALAQASLGQIAQLNGTQAQLVATATATGTQVAEELYGAGVKAAQGLVDGLKSQEAAIEAQMARIAAALAAALKKSLGIRSPSRVTYAIGLLTGDGLHVALVASRRKVADAAGALGRLVGTRIAGAAGLGGTIGVRGGIGSISAPRSGTAALLSAAGASSTHTTLATVNVTMPTSDPNAVAAAIDARLNQSRR